MTWQAGGSSLALILAAVGIYGVMAYVVMQRTHEIGVRMALGARRRDVFGMVIFRVIKTALIDLTAGFAASVMLTVSLQGSSLG